jgi:beta-lactamase class A
MTLLTDATVTERLDEMFADAGVDGFLHACDIDSGNELGYEPDAPVVTASTFKLPVLVELFRQADAGSIDLTAQVTVPAEGRAPGPTGVSVMLDAVTLSWRDLAQWMIVVSDNAATDVICAQVGLDNVNNTMRALGLTGTYLETDCRGIFATLVEDAGVASVEEFPFIPEPELLSRLRAVRPLDTDRTTPRDMTRLLQLICTDRAASAESCEHMRRILLNQVWPHRLAAGFPEDDVMTGGKTGTIILWRNEVGVAGFPDGGRFAVAVYTRSHQPRLKNPDADAVIGSAARVVVDALRATR